METRKHLASDKKASGKYNCAQAVACTYADKMGISEEQAQHMAAAFGTGMGNMEGTCGALVGAGIAAGMILKDRNEARKQMRGMMEKFRERNHATQCKLLKGLGTEQALRDCNDCVADAAEFLEEIINKVGNNKTTI